MAVLDVHRKQGLGQRILSALMQAACNRGDHRLVLHAQVSAQGFYAKAGFKPHGPVFEEAGIDHIEMWSELPAQMSSNKG
jgi:predicted GNAT family N-acyltransferase